MNKKKITGVLFAIVILIGVIFVWKFFSAPDPVDFSADIKPILNESCISCHGGVAKNGGFSLLFEEEALGNTKSGSPAILPGNALGSEMIKRVHSNNPEMRMPYKKAKLSDHDIDLLTRWINEGAKWGDHWAYSLPEKVAIPEEFEISKTASEEFLQNGIDRFILEKLETEELHPNAPADKNIISRRVAFDITGLPLSDKEFNDFNAGTISYEKLVDNLLSKPSFGEKWATWWLDMARYADSKGYEKDQSRTMWQYRDWVIKAFNKDMPYDQFTIEQLAGDLLPNPTMDQMIATAFHRNTMNNDEGGTEDEEFRVASVMDRVSTTFEVWQSTTIGCVQCHSHPYDPFLQKEYYNIMAFYNNARDEDTPSESPVLKFYNEEQQVDVDKVMDWVATFGNEKTTKAYADFLRLQEPVYHAHSAINFQNGVYDNHAAFNLWDDGSCVLENVYTKNSSYIYFKYNARHNGTKVTIRENDANGEVFASFTLNRTKGTVTERFPIKNIDRKVNLYLETNNDNVKNQISVMNVYWLAFIDDLPGEDEKDHTAINATFDKLLMAPTPTLPVMSENPAYMKRTTQIFTRGNWLMKADTVEAVTPKVLNAWNEDWPKNRLGFSKWLVDKKNPLTARTLVNRIWHQIYGVGLVSTIEDIGSQSAAPSHPEMLDWLSLRFMNELNWSIKSLVKEIVLSGTYRQNSETTPKGYQLDPDNVFYARGPRQRLSAEQIRDQALAISGLLSAKMYGPSVMPPQPDGVWQTVYNGQKWVESKGEDKYRRAVYTYLKRTSPYPSFMTFDSGSREVCTIRRTVTNTPLQALITLNDPVYVEAAYHLAKTMKTGSDLDESIGKGYEKATQSIIKGETLTVLKELYQTSLAEFENNMEAARDLLHFEDVDSSAELAALTVVANAIMNLDEFLTKA
jgi:hypothetical protein